MDALHGAQAREAQAGGGTPRPRVRRDLSTDAVQPALIEGAFLRTGFKLISVILSLALHAGAALAMLVWFEPRPGAVYVPSDAITLELIRTDVIETADVAAQPTAAAAANATAMHTGSTHDARTQLKAEPTRETTAHEPAHNPPETAPAPEPAPEQDARPAEVTPQPEVHPVPRAQATGAPDTVEVLESAEGTEPAPPPPTARAKPQPRPRAAPDTPSTRAVRKAPAKRRPAPTDRTAARKGGDPSRAAQASKAKSARASASRGDALNYAAIVRARVAARRPPSQGYRGTVYVTFGISRSGSLAFARISRPSGNSGLDQSVLAALRSAAPFPPPPAGASSSPRQFSMPFHFK